MRTPHFDRPVAGGSRCDRLYAAAPACSTTRDVTIGELMDDVGCATAHFGKRHLGLLSRSVKRGYAPGDPDPAQFALPWEGDSDPAHCDGSPTGRFTVHGVRPAGGQSTEYFAGQGPTVFGWGPRPPVR